MGRLDNAMRRAAEEAGAGTTAPESRHLMDVRDLPPAEFPSEGSPSLPWRHRRSRSRPKRRVSPS